MGKWKMNPDLTNTEPALGEQIKYQHKEISSLRGYALKYIQATETENNTIFSESTQREFSTLKGYDFFCLKDEDSMYTGSELYNSFGYTASYTNIFYVPILFFEEQGIEAQVGDLVFDETDNVLYEITKVGSKTESNLNIKINNTIFSVKLYLKQYQFGYKDSFDDELEDEFFDEDVNLQELDKLNDTLIDDIEDLDVIDDNEFDNVFGTFG